ncbi:hypothetical protein Bbelb_101360 [Branchiostoma belcheri]|nr:hypothetical protein Bbelb_101360 [Branchiostoma belcheri]
MTEKEAFLCVTAEMLQVLDLSVGQYALLCRAKKLQTAAGAAKPFPPAESCLIPAAPAVLAYGVTCTRCRRMAYGRTGTCCRARDQCMYGDLKLGPQNRKKCRIATYITTGAKLKFCQQCNTFCY